MGYNPIVLYVVAQVLPAFTTGSSFSSSHTHLTYSSLWALLLLLLLLFLGAICSCGLICVLTLLESVVLVICFCGSFAPSLGCCSDVSLGNSVPLTGSCRHSWSLGHWYSRGDPGVPLPSHPSIHSQGHVGTFASLPAELKAGIWTAVALPTIILQDSLVCEGLR